MAKFDIYRNPDGGGCLLDCQADLLSGLNTRFVIPLIAAATAPPPAARLNPVFGVAGEDHVMMTQFAASVPATMLREWVASLRQHDLTIGNAIDMLLSGY